MAIWTLLGWVSVCALLIGGIVMAVRSAVRQQRLERESLERQRLIAEQIRLFKRR